MTIEVTAAPVDVAAAARELVAGLRLDPWGQVSPSVYETGRVVALAPWLDGHRQRIDYLLASQRADGGWGGPDGYALVPTLSATDALLAAAGEGGAVQAAAERGLSVLGGWFRGGPLLPDTPAIELIVPALLESINGRLAGSGRDRLPPFAPIDGAALAGVRAVLAMGRAAPEKLLHAWEVVGPLAGRTAAVPDGLGLVGASPAATAARLRDRDGSSPARRYLEEVARHHGGPVPCAAPITVFERAWALSWLAEAGIPLTVPTPLIVELSASVGPAGTPAAPGLPQDADTTSVALSALIQLGVHREPVSLWAYETESHFCTWRGEDGESVSVNAHVLEAFGHYLAGRPDHPGRYTAAVERLTGWLVARQGSDGSWADRWHASPFYATACCALALDRFGVGPAARAAVEKAVEWAAATQRPDGSWGLWQGTDEETAYATRILLTRPDGLSAQAVARSYPLLLHSIRTGSVDTSGDPPMWHDKDLYSPKVIIRAAVLAALHQAQCRFS